MSVLGIETTIVSIIAPGIKICKNNKEKERILAKKLNEYSANLVKNNPKKIGYFASLSPLSNMEGTLDEIDYVYSILKLSGPTLFTSYRHDQYLGHPSFQSILVKLNELRTVIFIHPNKGPTSIVNRYLPQLLIKILLSYADGTFPFLGRRIADAEAINSLHYLRGPRQILADFHSFYYNTALSSSVLQPKALLKSTNLSKILFESDIPYASLPITLYVIENFDIFFRKNKVNRRKNL